MRRPSQQGGGSGGAVEAVEPPVRARADDQRAVGVERKIVRCVVARFPDLVPEPVGLDAKDCTRRRVGSGLRNDGRSGGLDARAGNRDLGSD